MACGVEESIHQPYTTGFYLPGENTEIEFTADASSIRGYDFIGTVDEHDQETNMLKVLGRNRFALGDTVEILDPDQAEINKFTISRIIGETGEDLEAAHNSYVVYLPLAENHAAPISKHAILRKKSSPHQ
ncbi:MAG: U32 family peptidase C-terminal domain-containing protein [Bacillota bacterium]